MSAEADLDKPRLTPKDKIALALFVALTAFPAIYCVWGAASGFASPWAMLTGAIMTISTQLSWSMVLFIAEGRHHDR